MYTRHHSLTPFFSFFVDMNDYCCRCCVSCGQDNIKLNAKISQFIAFCVDIVKMNSSGDIDVFDVDVKDNGV